MRSSRWRLPLEWRTHLVIIRTVLSPLRAIVLVGTVAAPLACGGRSDLLDVQGDPPFSSVPVEPPSDASTSVPDGAGPAVLDATVASDASPSPRTVDAAAIDASEVQLDAGTDVPEAPDSGPDSALPSTATCLTGGNVLWVDGDPDVWPEWIVGSQTVSGGSWGAEAESYYVTYDGALLEPHEGPGWFFQFGTFGEGSPVAAGVTYSNASEPPDGAVPIAASDFIIGYTGTCAVQTGTFRVEAFTASPGTEPQIGNLLTFTASFSAVCEGTGDVGVLRGCIHYDATNAQ